jgi:hypothetical protein
MLALNSTLSEKLPVISGIPQGSTLGPLLFSIYVNDLPSATKTCSSESYVDDTKLLLSFHINDSNAALVDLNENLKSNSKLVFRQPALAQPGQDQIDGLRKPSNACKAT